MKDKKFIVKDCKFKKINGCEFIVEFKVKELLVDLMFAGNWAARNAIEIEEYKFNDSPFYYGKIGDLGYIISEKNLV